MYLEFDLVKQRLTKKLWAESEALRRIAPQRLACLKAKRATNARSGRALASPGYQKASKDSGLYRAYLLVDIYKGNRKRLNLLTLSTPAASFAVRSVHHLAVSRRAMQASAARVAKSVERTAAGPEKTARAIEHGLASGER